MNGSLEREFAGREFAEREFFGRGFFGLGVENLSKPHNAGNLYRSAHAFGASFIFAISPQVNMRQIIQSDTSQSARHVPFYHFNSVEALTLPRDCELVGVELTEDAIDLPLFHHPVRAAYILGPERGSLSPEVLAQCKSVVKIPTRFCVNVGIAGAILLYDRMICSTRFARDKTPHHHGGRKTRPPKA